MENYTFDPQSFAVIVSSMAPHYVPDYAIVVACVLKAPTPPTHLSRIKTERQPPNTSGSELFRKSCARARLMASSDVFGKYPPWPIFFPKSGEAMKLRSDLGRSEWPLIDHGSIDATRDCCHGGSQS
jgi:hypothetical protein